LTGLIGTSMSAYHILGL